MAALLLAPLRARADDSGVVLELGFTPAPRSQIAIWLEDDQGHFIRTLQLTEAVAFRGVGNRPGASQMNSGYRWPYGRREGILPIWASRRAAVPGAKPFKRVIFQNRVAEGLASRTTPDNSGDAYFCLSFNQSTTTRAALDAVSCASPFTSDKGRFITQADVAANYHEPFEDNVTHMGMKMPLPLNSLYPPRMDVTRCTDMNCFDHADVAAYAAHAREVMPEIDAITLATPPGNTKQSLLFSLPANWPKGKYVLWFEIDVEGDYNATYSDTNFATPKEPMAEWDSWAMTYGYPYRGQPSIAFQVPFELAGQSDVTLTAATAVGHSSWDFWSPGYGALSPMTDITDDPSKSPGSGADRLKRDAQGQRLTLRVRTLTSLPDPDPNMPIGSTGTPGSGASGSSSADAGVATDAGTGTGSADAGTAPAQPMANAPASSAPPEMQRDPDTNSVILVDDKPGAPPIGEIRGLKLSLDPSERHAHEWVKIQFVAPTSEEPLHDYDVRVSTDAPIVDEQSFIQSGRPAKTASADPEGAVSLMLPVKTAPGELVEGEIGDLTAETHYYIGVRATDGLNRHGSISVAQITTPKRKFATVTPCFVATAVYGAPLAAEVSALRRFRDRQLMNHPLGRTLVRAYYARGAALAAELRAHEGLRRAARALLTPIVALARALEQNE